MRDIYEESFLVYNLLEQPDLFEMFFLSCSAVQYGTKIPYTWCIQNQIEKSE